MTGSARLIALLLTAFAFCFFSLRRPSASYYLMMLAPACLAGALYLLDCEIMDVRDEIERRVKERKRAKAA